MLAERLNLSRADVHGVVSFYHDFRLEGPAGEHVRLEERDSEVAVFYADHRVRLLATAQLNRDTML